MRALSGKLGLYPPNIFTVIIYFAYSCSKNGPVVESLIYGRVVFIDVPLLFRKLNKFANLSTLRHFMRICSDMGMCWLDCNLQNNKLYKHFSLRISLAWVTHGSPSMAVSLPLYRVCVLATLTLVVSSTSTSATETSLTASPDATCFSPVINNQASAKLIYFLVYFISAFGVVLGARISCPVQFYKYIWICLLWLCMPFKIISLNASYPPWT